MQNTAELDQKNHELRLQITELKISNQEHTEQVREIKLQAERLKSEEELSRVNAMDEQIEKLIKEMGNYKADYFKALEES